jgi:hypothetical protein
MARNLLDKSFFISYLEAFEMDANRGRNAASQGTEIVHQGANRVELFRDYRIAILI